MFVIGVKLLLISHLQEINHLLPLLNIWLMQAQEVREVLNSKIFGSHAKIVTQCEITYSALH